MRRKPRRPLPEGHVDEPYKAWCRAQPCCVPACGVSPCEPHHAGQHGLSQLPPDSTCIPLDPHHHDERHRLLGFFRTMSKAARREWEDEQIAIHRARYAFARALDCDDGAPVPPLLSPEAAKRYREILGDD